MGRCIPVLQSYYGRITITLHKLFFDAYCMQLPALLYRTQDTHLGCSISSFNPILEKNYQLNHKEDRCSVLIEYADYYDNENNVLKTTEYCDFIGMHHLHHDTYIKVIKWISALQHYYKAVYVRTLIIVHISISVTTFRIC